VSSRSNAPAAPYTLLLNVIRVVVLLAGQVTILLNTSLILDIVKEFDAP